MEVVIRKMGDVNYSEVYDLGLALFHRGKEIGLSQEAIVERTDLLLKLLHEEDRIEIDQETQQLTASTTNRAERRLTAVQ